MMQFIKPYIFVFVILITSIPVLAADKVPDKEVDKAPENSTSTPATNTTQATTNAPANVAPAPAKAQNAPEQKAMPTQATQGQATQSQPMTQTTPQATAQQPYQEMDTAAQRLLSVELSTIYSKAKADFKLRRFRDAYNGFLAYVMKKQDDAMAYYSLGETAFLLGKFDIAEQAFTSAIAIDSELKKAYVDLAELYLTLNRNTDAIAIYVKLYNKFPKDPEIRLNIANVYLRAGAYKDAASILSVIIVDDLGASPAYVYNLRGTAYYELGNYPNALNDFNTAIQKDPLQPSFFYNRSITHYAMGNLKDARADSEEYSKLKAGPTATK